MLRSGVETQGIAREQIGSKSSNSPLPFIQEPSGSQKNLAVNLGLKDWNIRKNAGVVKI